MRPKLRASTGDIEEEFYITGVGMPSFVRGDGVSGVSSLPKQRRAGRYGTASLRYWHGMETGLETEAHISRVSSGPVVHLTNLGVGGDDELEPPYMVGMPRADEREDRNNLSKKTMFVEEDQDTFMASSK